VRATQVKQLGWFDLRVRLPRPRDQRLVERFRPRLAAKQRMWRLIRSQSVRAVDTLVQPNPQPPPGGGWNGEEKGGILLHISSSRQSGSPQKPIPHPPAVEGGVGVCQPKCFLRLWKVGEGGVIPFPLKSLCFAHHVCFSPSWFGCFSTYDSTSSRAFPTHFCKAP
jgi:hypothetical protein